MLLLLLFLLLLLLVLLLMMVVSSDVGALVGELDLLEELALTGRYDVREGAHAVQIEQLESEHVGYGAYAEEKEREILGVEAEAARIGLGHRLKVVHGEQAAAEREQEHQVVAHGARHAQYVDEELAREVGYVKDGFVVDDAQLVEQLKRRVHDQVDDERDVERAHLDHVRVEAICRASVVRVEVLKVLVALELLDVEEEEERVGRYGAHGQHHYERELDDVVPVVELVQLLLDHVRHGQVVAIRIASIDATIVRIANAAAAAAD